VGLADPVTWADRLAQSSKSVIKLFAIATYPHCLGLVSMAEPAIEKRQR